MITELREYVRRLPRPIKIGAGIVAAGSAIGFWTLPAAAQYWNNDDYTDRYGRGTGDYRMEYERLRTHVERICNSSDRYEQNGDSSDRMSALGLNENGRYNSSVGDIDDMIDILYEVREMCRDFTGGSGNYPDRNDDDYNNSDGRDQSYQNDDQYNTDYNNNSGTQRYDDTIDNQYYLNGNETSGNAQSRNVNTNANVNTNTSGVDPNRVFVDSNGDYYRIGANGQHILVNQQQQQTVNVSANSSANAVSNSGSGLANTSSSGEGRCLNGVDMISGYRTEQCYGPFKAALQNGDASYYINNRY